MADSTNALNHMVNGSFENGTVNGIPNGWNFGTSSPKVKLSCEITADNPFDGKSCLKLTSDYPSEPEVYGLMKAIIPCKPYTEYQLTMYLRSDGGMNTTGTWFGGGRDWRWINGMPAGKYGWTRVDSWYRTAADETSFPFLIVVAGQQTLYVDAVSLVEMGPSTDPTVRPQYTAQEWPEIADKLTAMTNKVSTWKTRLAALKQAGAHTDYATMDLAIIESYLPLVERHLRDEKYRLALTVMTDELRQVGEHLDARLAGLDNNPNGVPQFFRYQTGRITPRGYAEMGTVLDPTTGKIITRPVIFNGWGHFTHVVDELPNWTSRGANIIGTEMGPQMVAKQADGTLRIRETPSVQSVVEMLNIAARANQKVSFLVSPHYMPNEAGGIWSSDAPGVQDYMDAYLRTLIPAIKDIPSLHSIILSNEPHSYATPSDPYQQRAWHEYLRTKYHTIAALNTAYGHTSYQGWWEVPIPTFSRPGYYTHTQKPWFYDWVRCEQLRFTAWHQRLATVIHEMAPNLPVHAKITGGVIMGGAEADGIDPELFTGFTQYGGFDEVGGVRIIYDLMPSLMKAPLINSENHLLQPDINYDYLDADRLYSDLFCQFMHGQTSSVTWLYEPNYEGLDVMTFSIRPLGMEAIDQCGVEAMRAAPELAAIQEAPRQVAIIYSNLSLFYTDSHHQLWRDAWNAFHSTGLRVRFLSEAQIQRGDFGAVKVLILPEAQVVEPTTVKGLAAFVQHGGKIISVGHSLEFTEGWTPIDQRTVTPLIWRKLNEVTPDWGKQLTAWVREAGIKPLVNFTVPAGQSLDGVHWLSGMLNGQRVVAITNRSGKTVNLTVEGVHVATLHNVLNDTEMPNPLTLPNFGCVLLRIPAGK